METLFDLPEPEELLPKRIGDMYALFGKDTQRDVWYVQQP